MAKLPASLPIVPSAGDLPVESSDEVLALLPAFVRATDSAPVRDGIAAGLAAILKRHQLLAAYSAAQSDLLRATGLYLEGLCDDLGVIRHDGEEQEALRGRALTTPDLVTPEAILAAANALLAPWTRGHAQYIESGLDRLFISDGTADWHSFVGASPSYPDRLYPDDAVRNGGDVRAQSDPGGAWIFSDNIGRFFVLRVPLVAAVDVPLAYAGSKLAASDADVPERGGAEPAAYPPLAAGDLPPASGGRGLFIADGSDASAAESDGSVATFLFAALSDPLSIYQAVATAVERIKGHSIRWALVSDPRL
jgi:hypothetical protein